MATILPFRAIRPNPFYAGKLVFAKPQAESVADNELKPLKTLLETGARQRPETPEGQAMAYRDIKEMLYGLLQDGRLWRENTPGIYIYEISHAGYKQTGIWALTALEDYRQGNIKPHELTFANSVRRISNYREHTALEGSPVLLTYPPDETINGLIALTKATNPDAAFGNQQGKHRLWKIEDVGLQQQFIAAFAQLPHVYLADGHHRFQSAAALAQEQQKTGEQVYDTISSLYMATDQLRLERYDRVIIPTTIANPESLFRRLCTDFHLMESTGNQPVHPQGEHRFGMCLNGQWYHLLAREHTYMNACPVCGTDAAILQKYILAPVFGITDPGTDNRLKCAGGEKAPEEIGAIMKAYPQAIAFTLSPLTTGKLISVADSGGILPPKSTWVVPKVPYGLLIHQH